jgi:hypothetical protein
VGEVGVLDELIVLIRFARALRMIEREKRKRRLLKRLRAVVGVATAVSRAVKLLTHRLLRRDFGVLRVVRGEDRC